MTSPNVQSGPGPSGGVPARTGPRPGAPAERSNQLTYRLFVNSARTVLVTCWTNGEIEVAFRDDPGATWSPPVRVVEETV